MNSPPDPAAEATARDMLWTFAQQSLEHAILHLDGDRRVTWASPGAAKILGAEPGAIVGGLTDRFFVPEDVHLGIPQHEINVATSHGVADDNRWMQRADGARFWASGLLLALRDEHGEVIGFTKILRNQTDMKMLLDTLGNRAASMAEANENKTTAIATIAHELRNPLASIGMAAHLLQKQIGGGQPGGGQAGGNTGITPTLAILSRNVEFAERLVNDLQDASRIGARKLELRPERLHLGSLLQEAMEAARQSAADPDREFNLLLPPGEPIELLGDRLRLQQVFVNLLGNAIKFTETGSVRLVTSFLRPADDPALMQFDVIDTGIGLTEEQATRLFQPFVQADSSTTRRFGGSGLGLVISRRLADLLGGSVTLVRTAPGVGSHFRVAIDAGFAEQGTEAGYELLPDYSVPFLGDSTASLIVRVVEMVRLRTISSWAWLLRSSSTEA